MSSLGIGEQLIEAREERGLTLDSAERDTRISRRYLQALEDERFDIIPAPVYARGFLRSYSQYLGLDSGRLLARFPQDSPAPGPSSSPAPASGPTRGPSALFGSRVPEEPMIGVDIGVTMPARRIGGGFSFARTGIVAAVAVGVTALVIVIAVAIANAGGESGEGTATPAPTSTPTGESEAGVVATGSGIAVERGVVPDVVGQPEDVARLAIEEAGFEVTVVADRNEQYPRGTVFEQAPTAGAEQEPGRGVFIAVSEGP